MASEKTRKIPLLAIANQMYIDAFQIKKARFTQLFPELSKTEIHRRTLEYFHSLHEKKK